MSSIIKILLFSVDRNCSLQQYAEIPKQKHAGGPTARNVIDSIDLTEPQGIIKKPYRAPDNVYLPVIYPSGRSTQLSPVAP